ncbi:MAG: CYTH domain-containing protein [Candidatus Omnitrophota bacterium]
MPIEREYKYLVEVNAEDLEKLVLEKKEIEQFYLVIKDNYEIRMRRFDNTYYLTFKGDGTLERPEQECPITREMFEACKPHCQGHVIQKNRYVYEGENKWEIDIYNPDSNLAGLKVAEVEVNSNEDIPQMPEIFFNILTNPTDVTSHKGYKNKNLARDGLPKDHPISHTTQNADVKKED